MELEFSFRISFSIFDKLREKGAEFKRRVGDKYLYHNGNGFDLVDRDGLPDELKNNNDSNRRRNRRKSSESSRSGSGWNWKTGDDKKKKERDDEEVFRGSRNGRQYRDHVYDGSSDSKVAKRAADNHYVMQDVLSDPSLVGAESETEAVSKVASENPSWAKMSDLVDTYDIDVDADGNIDTGSSSADSGSSAAEAASEAASYSGGVSTADAGDLGPSTAGDYGMDTGGTSGSGDGGTGDSGLGGDAGGGSAGGGDL